MRAAVKIRPVDTFATVLPAPLVTLAQVKARLKVEHSVDDDLLEAEIAAACAYLDGPRGAAGRALGGGAYSLRFEGRVPVMSRLYFGLSGRALGVISVNGGDAESTQVLHEYGEPYVIATSVMAASENLTLGVTYEAANEPCAVALAHLMIGQAYQHREEVITDRVSKNPAVLRLLNNLKSSWAL